MSYNNLVIWNLNPKPIPTIARKKIERIVMVVAAQEFVKSVGNECQLTPLNYRNQVLHSMTTCFARDEQDSGLSIKHVVHGTERYRIGTQWHHITDGRFLVVNEHQSFQCRVDSRQPVEGLCIYLDPSLVYEIAHAWRAGHAALLDQGLETTAPQTYFLEKIYGLGENTLGNFLESIVPILRDPSLRAEADMKWIFLKLSENLLRSQGEVDQLVERLEHERRATREEIFRRVSLARQHIDAHYLEEICLDEIAATAHFSKYHFLRCFKQVYGMSPYQYVLQRRLDEARSQLRHSRRSLSEIAVETGFGDRRAFNKAFRKAFGLNPADFRAH